RRLEAGRAEGRPVPARGARRALPRGHEQRPEAGPRRPQEARARGRPGPRGRRARPGVRGRAPALRARAPRRLERARRRSSRDKRRLVRRPQEVRDSMAEAAKEADTSKKMDERMNPAEVEPRWYAEWERRGVFHAEPTDPRPPFSMVIPPPNVTGVLHMGHALNNTFQDLIVRWRRMQGRNACWI